MERISVRYKDGSIRKVTKIFAEEHRNEIDILYDVPVDEVKEEISEIQRLRNECDQLGIQWHHKAKASTLSKKIKEAKEE